jgi:hypothetical protein
MLGFGDEALYRVVAVGLEVASHGGGDCEVALQHRSRRRRDADESLLDAPGPEPRVGDDTRRRQVVIRSQSYLAR